MDADARQMPSPRSRKSVNLVVRNEGKALKRAIKLRGGRIEKQEMAETFRNENPTPHQRVAEDQRRVVPHKTIAERRRVNEKGRRYDNEDDDWAREIFQDSNHAK